MHLTADREHDGVRVRLQGDWHALALPEILREVDAVALEGERPLTVDTRDLKSMDSSGAWALRHLLKRAEQGGAQVTVEGDRPPALDVVEKAMAEEARDSEKPPEHEMAPLAQFGRRVVRRWNGVRNGLEYVGRVSVVAARASVNVKRWRLTSVTRHVYETGITAIPIVSLIAFLISVIIAYMSAQQLRELGAEIFVVDLVTIGVLRELGVLLTAIIVAGRSGSAFAAEIGAMKLNEEVDALIATGVEPIEVLVLPRILGLVIALPLLTIISDGIGLAGGALLCQALLDMPITQYLARMQDAIAPTTFWAGLIKAPVFALLIAVAGTYRGLQVRDSSRELGRLTTMAVVQSIFLVIFADALFAVLFMELDI